eukprot:4670075-Pyramimonas_sp.AAC.1
MGKGKKARDARKAQQVGPTDPWPPLPVGLQGAKPPVPPSSPFYGLPPWPGPSQPTWPLWSAPPPPPPGGRRPAKGAGKGKGDDRKVKCSQCPRWAWVSKLEQYGNTCLCGAPFTNEAPPPAAPPVGGGKAGAIGSAMRDQLLELIRSQPGSVQAKAAQ